MHPATVSLASDGLVFRAFRTVGAATAEQVRPLRGIVTLILVTWVPLAVLCALDGTLVGGGVEVPFLSDPAVNARLLVALPLLLLGEIKFASVARMLFDLIRERHLVPEAELPALDARVERLVHERDSWLVEGLIIAGSAALMWFTRDMLVTERIGTHATWMGAGTTLSRAGWYYASVSLFVANVLGLRWVWWIITWTRFLTGFLRPRIVVIPGHPDQHGGLAFLTIVQSAFALVLAALATTVAGRLAFELLHDGATLAQVRVPAIVVLVLALLVMFGPLFLFAGRMARLKRQALMQYDGLGQQLVSGFERKWLGADRTDEPFLGSPDPSTYTDYVSVYASLRLMKPTPLDPRRAIGAILLVLAPFVPLLLTVMSLKEVLVRMVKLVM